MCFRWFYAGCSTNRARSLETTVRPATQDDRSAVESLYLELKRHHHELVPSALRYNVPDENWIAVIRAGMADPDQRFFVAEQHGRVIAFMRLRIDDRFFGRACEVDTVSVASNFRNQRIGRTLMDEAERFAREAGAIAMRVNVLSVNESGRQFYEGLGYEVVAHRYAKDLD